MTNAKSSERIRDSEVFHPESLRASLLLASLLVVVYEMLREAAVDHLRSLYSNGFDADGWKVDRESYRDKVLSRHKDQLAASLLWFVEQNAWTGEDFARFEEIRSVRNRVVHNLIDVLRSTEMLEAAQAYSDLVDLLRKLEVWWIRYFEMEVSPESHPPDLSDDEILPGQMLVLRMLADTAFGEGEDALKWHNMYLEIERQLDAERAKGPA